MVHWDDKVNPTLDGALKEKCLSVSVSEKEHKLLKAPSLGNHFRNIYDKRVCEEVMKLLKNGNV